MDQDPAPEHWLQENKNNEQTSWSANLVEELLQTAGQEVSREADDAGDLPLEVEPDGLLGRDGVDGEVVEDVPLGHRGPDSRVIAGTHLPIKIKTCSFLFSTGNLSRKLSESHSYIFLRTEMW